jgi:hypothetical protein
MKGGRVEDEGASDGGSNREAPPELRRRRRVAEQMAREGRNATEGFIDIAPILATAVLSSGGRITIGGAPKP